MRSITQRSEIGSPVSRRVPVLYRHCRSDDLAGTHALGPPHVECLTDIAVQRVEVLVRVIFGVVKLRQLQQWWR